MPLYIVFGLLLLAIIVFPKFSILSLLLVLSILYIAVQLFRFILVFTGAMYCKNKEILKVPDELPIYSILLPIYHEDKVLKDLINSIKKIDYPADLLGVKLLIEEGDVQTLHALNEIKLPKFVELIKVPDSYPRTKPKARNYGLQVAKGKYVTIYDAEDRPHTQQLKQVVAKFAVSDVKIVCIQAKLNFYNREENIITKLFALEYALLFNYILVGLQRLKMPIPLGGTSNHFIREKLEKLGGWDAFNVTEDADIGVRIYQQGYRTEVIDSLILEESPIHLSSWIIQRSRWIKGNFLTGLVHLNACKNLPFKARVGLFMGLFLPNFIYPLLPFYVVLNCFFIDNSQLNLLWWLNIYLSIILPISYGLLIIYNQKCYSLKSIVFIVPFYYTLLSSMAGVRAALEIFRRPFHWGKTQHSVSKLSK